MSYGEHQFVLCPQIVQGERCNELAEIFVTKELGEALYIGAACLAKHVTYLPTEAYTTE